MRNLISLYARSSKDFAGWAASGARLARVADETDCVAALLMASPLSDVRKRLDIVGIRDAAVSDRIPQLEHESVGGTNAAAGGEGSAEHDGALPQFTVSVNDCFRREHRGHGSFLFFFQAEDGIRDYKVTGVQTCALPIYVCSAGRTGTVPLVQRLGADT